ncbi:mitotic spindle assembly checkpoint protein MAD2A-like [Drosophila miranda]|uniref:mitotic spindle assembly checkpoint protein MAD2A-like n=1 Tax=Drosophila miranda TaxID=7229 RepID=UPI00143F223A|nr:mitotic spindle assembly checkpoint protein MAD2A-like [Drosophila miranda]
MSSAQATKICITLKGSAQIIVDSLKYGIHSILFQRGVYPADKFEATKQYGLTILMSEVPRITTLLQNVLSQTEEWLSKNMIRKVSMVITNSHSKEVLECWEFKMEAEKGDNQVTDHSQSTSSKDLTRIQNEIREVMRQISASVSYLPLLECICDFDLKIHTPGNTEIPAKWD